MNVWNRMIVLRIFLFICILLSGCHKNEENIIWNEESVTEAATETEIQIETQAPALCYVDICGAVNQPGVYGLVEGSRIYQVIDLAGGLTEDADIELINRAQTVTDGMKIRIYTTEEVQNRSADRQDIFSDPDMTGTDNTGQGTDPDKKDSIQQININTADVDQLMTLSGIGESRANDIISYRNEHGAFQSIEEIMNVSGIKESTFDKIKDKITTQ